jgi:hypothetical protein
MTPDSPEAPRSHLLAALSEAYGARLGVPSSLEALVRAFARAEREVGVPVERFLVDLKRILAETVHEDADIFAKRVVGWAVAGYYHGTRDPHS